MPGEEVQGFLVKMNSDSKRDASELMKKTRKEIKQKRKLNTDDKASKEKKRKGFEKKKYCK